MGKMLRWTLRKAKTAESFALQRGFDAVAFGGERHCGVIQLLLHSIRKFFAGLAHDRDIAQMNTGRSLVLEVPTSDEEIGY